MITIPRIPSRIALAAACCGLAAAGCGSDDATTGAAERSATLDVTQTEFAMEPANGRVDREGRVRIAVVNRGEVPHALAVETPDGVVKTDTLAAGESGTVEAELEDGTYAWFCPVGDHRERGMEGKLTVGGGERGETGEESKPPSGGFGY